MAERRVAITGMAVNTPLADNLEGFLSALLEGRSAITQWKLGEGPDTRCKVGGDLSGYDAKAKAALLAKKVPSDMSTRMTRLLRVSPWSTQLSVLLAVDAFVHAGLAADAPTPDRVAAVVGGHDLNLFYAMKNFQEFVQEPGYINPHFSLNSLDSDHMGCVADVVHAMGPIYTSGGACASGNVALRNGHDEVRYHGLDVALVVCPVVDMSPIWLHSLAMVRAISTRSFNTEPERASRPFDALREGFVPSHGGAAVVLEDLDRARARGATIHAELVGVEVCSGADHLPRPSEAQEALVMERVLRGAGVDPTEVDLVSAHATSTKAGDLAEAKAIRKVFGDRTSRLKVNAPKSMLGHTIMSSALVECVAAVLQMQAGKLHPSINVDRLDPEIDLDVCAGGAVSHPVNCVLNNAFGFGGIYSASLVRRCPDR